MSRFKNKLKKLGYKTYAGYLRSAHWQAVRKRYAKSKRKKVCECCGDAHYQLHHNSYDNLGAERLKDLNSLCKICHFRVHAYLKSHKDVKLSDTKLILEAIKKLK